MAVLFCNEDPLKTLNEAHDLEWIMALDTSVQVGLPGIGKPEAQIKMLEEFSDKYTKKLKLINVEDWERQQANKPLDGQENLL